MELAAGAAMPGLRRVGARVADRRAGGIVYSWTRLHRASTPDRAGLVPYVVVLVAIPHAGDVRLMGLLDGPDAGLAIGRPARASFHPPTELSRGLPTVRWALLRDGAAA